MMIYRLLMIALAIPLLLFVKCSEELPKVLIIGDSVAGGYFPYVEKQLAGKAKLFKPMVIDEKGDTTSCEGTTMGVKQINEWIGDTDWDVIHFNFGLHDIKHIDPETGKNSKNLNHPHQASPAQYGKNLQLILEELKATNATLIFATTTPYPDKLRRQMRSPGMYRVYNEVALNIMDAHAIAVDDLNTLVLPNIEKWMKPNNVHFNEAGSKALGNQVAKAITNQL